MNLTYASVCSGIEAASVAWHPLGWRCAFVSEIEPFPCAVLKHHWPDVPNLGDMTKFADWNYETDLDVLVGGTPCQSFSVAGLRKGLDDPRGNLMLTFGAIAAKYRPTWLVWENVPGVLSSNGGQDFASFLGLITGQTVQPPSEGWENSGILAGIDSAYGIAWRVLDAQYFGVAQRRRRVFVVGHLGGQWQRAAAVLFERESLCGNPPPLRQSREGTARDAAQGVAMGDALRAVGNQTGSGSPSEIERTNGGQELSRDVRGTTGAERLTTSEYVAGYEVCPTIGASGRGFERASETRGQDPVIAVANSEFGIRNSELEAIPINMQCATKNGVKSPNGVGDGSPGSPTPTLGANDRHAVCATLTKNYATHHGRTAGNNGGVAENQLIPCGIEGGELGFALRANPSHSGDKGDGGLNTTMVAEIGTRHSALGTLEVAHSLRADGFDASEDGTGRGTPLVPEVLAHGQGNAERVSDGEPSLTCNHEAPILFSAESGMRNTELNSELRTPNSELRMAVRRLTPRECERLQGFPDDYTLIPLKTRKSGKVNWSKDGPRYKALGNSMAVPNMRWIGERIELVEQILSQLPPTSETP